MSIETLQTEHFGIRVQQSKEFSEKNRKLPEVAGKT
jgi:hypothetical protein